MAKLKKRPDGRYQLCFRYDDKRYVVYGRTKQELEDKKTEKIMELKEMLAKRANPLLDDYYDSFEELNRLKVKESTIRNQRLWYTACAKIRIESAGKALGRIRIRDITPKDCQAVQKALIDSGKSSRTVNNYMDQLSHVFNVAVRDETIDRNPCMCIEPVRRTEPTAAETKHRALSKTETTAFLEGAEGSYYLNHFRMMLNSGIRVGELGAILDSDVDMKQECIHITKTVTRNDIGGYEIGQSTKTYAGRRDIPLTPALVQIISSQRKLNEELFGVRLGKPLFVSADGCLLRDYPINREIKRITSKAGIEHFTCHAFRATFATRWMEQRPQDFKILSEILGHADTKITLNLYTHVMKEEKENAMRSIIIAG